MQPSPSEPDEMIQTALAYAIVAAAAAWSLRGFLPRLRPVRVKAPVQPKAGCDNCDCGH